LDHACYGFDNPIDRWNKINADYLSNSTDEQLAQRVRHEDILTEETQREVLKRIEKAFGLTRRDPTAIFLKTQVRSVFTNQKVLPYAMPFGFYRGQEYLNRYTQPQLDKINKRLDPEVMKALDYSYFTDANR
jgi:uncharacterized protein YecE (DUF72 family)